MSYLIAVALTGTLGIVFFLILLIERKRRTRFFEASRTRLDRKASRVLYTGTHVDWNGFAAHLFKFSLSKIAHDIVHGILLFVRGVEKFLTRAIRALREHIHYTYGSEGGFEIRRIIRQFRKPPKE